MATTATWRPAGAFPCDNREGHMHGTVNLASTNDDHLQSHPDVLIFDQDDRFVLVRMDAEALARKEPTFLRAARSDSIPLDASVWLVLTL